MRLIDADALFINLDGMMTVSPTGYIHGDTVAEMINDAPTVDAVPVVHGRWDKGTDSYWHICEECGAEVDISMGTGVWVEGVELHELKYCPVCGARMDAERKE